MTNKVLKPTTAQRLLKKLAEPEGRDVSRYGYTPRDLESGAGGRAYRWQVVTAGSELRVIVGGWERNGRSLTLTADIGENYKTLTGPGNPPSGSFSSNTTYWVYAILEHSTNDPALYPDSVVVAALSSQPTEPTLTGNIYRLLAVVTTDSSGVFVSNQRRWFGGDIEDAAIIPDSESGYSSGATFKNYSIDFRSTLGRHYKDLQIFEWEAPTQAAPESSDLLMFQDIVSNERILRYVTLSNLADNITPELDLDYIAEWLNTNSEIIHNRLDFTNDGPGDATGSNTGHDARYWPTYDVGSFVDNKNYRTIGDVYAVLLGICDNLGAPVVGNEWTVAAFKYLMDNGAQFEADTDHEFTGTDPATQGRVKMLNTEKATMAGGGAGGVQAEGGIYGKTNIVINNLTDDLDFAGSFHYKGGGAGGENSAQFASDELGGRIWNGFEEIRFAEFIDPVSYAARALSGYIDGSAAEGFSVDGTPGVTIGGWAKKGIIISEAEHKAFIVSIINDILGGHGIL